MRRAFAFAGIVILLLLAATLVWRVWVHHEEAPLMDEHGALVRLDSSVAHSEKITPVLR